MTHRQKEKLQDIFENYQIVITYMFPLDFIVEEWGEHPSVREALEYEDISDLSRVFGEKIAKAIDNNNPDTAFYLHELGGVFMAVNIRPLDVKSIELDEEGNFNDGYCATYSRVIWLHARNFDAAICKACAEAKKLRREAIWQARVLRDGAEKWPTKTKRKEKMK